MKVTFIKDHLNHNAGDTVDLPDGLANYLVRVQAAKVASKESATVAKEKKKAPAKKVAKE